MYIHTQQQSGRIGLHTSPFGSFHGFSAMCKILFWIKVFFKKQREGKYYFAFHFSFISKAQQIKTLNSSHF